ncbi:MAG: hypothetical protein JW713_06535 [Pontiellaceae bacterium]|nr:hypothetical protein [Pontiellaceae bacterium]
MSRKVYSVDLVDQIGQQGDSTTIPAGGSLVVAVPLYPYEENLSFSMGLKVSGAGTLKVTSKVQLLQEGNFAPYNVSDEVASGVGVASGEKVYAFDLPVCRQVEFTFAETGGANPVTVDVASLCFI